MARIEGVEPSKASLFSKIAYHMTRKRLGRVITPIAITAHHPRLLRAQAHMELGQEAAKTVPAQVKMLVQVKVAMMIGCPFWIDIGSAVGRQQGLTDDKLEALANYQNHPALTEEERLVLDYAVCMTRTPVEVSDELFRRLEAGFDRRQLVELTSCIAWENYRARYDHAFGIEAEGFSEGSYCPVPDRAVWSVVPLDANHTAAVGVRVYYGYDGMSEWALVVVGEG